MVDKSGSAAGRIPRPSQNELADYLAGIPLFRDLDREALLSISHVSRLVQLPKGYVLFIQEDVGDAAYLVHEGAIAISLTMPDGRELVINEMRQGDFFGELALLGGELRSASAIARIPSEVIRIPRAEFLHLVETQPGLMRQLLETIGQRLRSSGERESALAFLDAPARVAKFLLQRGRQDSDRGDLVRISQEELAQHVGVTRQTVAKILGSWRREGWIITGRGRIMLVDQAALARLS
jgi:CRP-like cAMP-binding protein